MCVFFDNYMSCNHTTQASEATKQNTYGTPPFTTNNVLKETSIGFINYQGYNSDKDN